MVFSFENITFSREERPLFHALGYCALPGSFLVLRGPNGCGKSTLLQLLASLIPTRWGTISYQGVPMLENREEIMEHLIYIGHRNGLYPHYTVKQQVDFWAKSIGNVELIDATFFYFGLDAVASQPLRHLSAGWKRRVCLSQLLLNPKASVWLLDEPFANLDKEGKEALLRLIATKCDQGGIVIAAVHEEINLPFGHNLYLPEFCPPSDKDAI